MIGAVVLGACAGGWRASPARGGGGTAAEGGAVSVIAGAPAAGSGRAPGCGGGGEVLVLSDILAVVLVALGV